MSKYLIVLFKDKKRKKIINKFLTLKNADEFYKNYLKQNDEIIFEKLNIFGKNSRFELGLIETGKSPDKKVYLKDDFGRSIEVKVEDDNVSILKINPVRVEELIYDVSNKKKIKATELIKKYLSGSDVKLISGLNNKVVVQKDDKFDLFTFKNIDDANRFLSCLENHNIKNKKMDCIIVKDSSKAQKKYLYNILESKGFDRQFLYRKFTVAPRLK